MLGTKYVAYIGRYINTRVVSPAQRTSTLLLARIQRAASFSIAPRLQLSFSERRKMASFQGVALTVYLMVVLVSAIPEKCHIPDEDWEVLAERFLAQMPNEYIFPRHSNNSSKSNEVLPGVTTGEMTLTGLSHLERYGTVRVYCKNGKPLVSVSMVARAPLKISVPWKYCGGKSGVVATTANHVKVCVNFEVEAVDNKVSLRPVRVSPKWIETMDVKLEGAGDVIKTVASVIGKLMPAYVKDFWIENLPWRMHKVLEQIRK